MKTNCSETTVAGVGQWKNCKQSLFIILSIELDQWIDIDCWISFTTISSSLKCMSSNEQNLQYEYISIIWSKKQYSLLFQFSFTE